MSNLSEEEKKAIELLKILSKTKPYIIWGDNNVPYNKANKINTLLNLIEKQQAEINKEKEKNKKAIEMLQEQIKHCEQEAKGSLNNEICHIALKFDKHILQELLQEGDK